jgi:hypothetical protein
VQRIDNYLPELKGNIILFLFIFLGVGIIAFSFYRVIPAWFVMDDYRWLDVPFSEISRAFYSDWGHGNVFRPLMRISFYVDWYFFGENPIGWHIHSLIVHLLNILWIFLIANLLTKKPYLSLALSLIFATLPCGHENICWISGRTHLVGAFFYLGSIYFFLLYRWAAKPVVSYFIISLILFLFGLMSYETIFSLPLTILFSIWCLSDYLQIDKKSFYRILGIYIGIFILLLSYRFILLGYTLGEANRHHSYISFGILTQLLKAGSLPFRLVSNKYLIPIVLLIGIITAGIIKPKLYYKIYLQLLVFGFILYSPFIIVEGVTYRFMYMAQIPLVIALALSIYLVYNYIKWGKYIAIALFLIMMFHFVKSNRVLANDWRVAGEIARTIPKQVKLLYPEKPQGYNFIFYGIPDEYRKAGVFLTYFDRAVKRQYTSFGGGVIRAEHYKNDAIKLIDGTFAPAKYFIYQPLQSVVLEISEDDWIRFIKDAHLK